jgi:hypothetical protein
LTTVFVAHFCWYNRPAVPPKDRMRLSNAEFQGKRKYAIFLGDIFLQVIHEQNSRDIISIALTESS